MKIFRSIILINSVLLGTSCSNDLKNEEVSNPNLQVPVAIEKVEDEITTKTTMLSTVTDADLAGKCFASALEKDLSVECGIEIACDCCAGNFLFNADSTFYDFSYCIVDTCVLWGTYKWIGNKLALYYSGTSFNETYNWEAEEDSTVKPISHSYRTYKPTTSFYTLFNCDSRLKLVPDNPEYYSGIQSDENGEKLTKYIVDRKIDLNYKK